MHWLAAPACSLSLHFFFLKMPSVFLIFTVFSSPDLWAFVFCVQNMFQPWRLLLNTSYFLFNLLCSLFLPRLPSPSPTSWSLPQFVFRSLSRSLWTPSPITLSFSLSWLFCMIDATIYFPWNPWGIWKREAYVHVLVCVCVWIVMCTCGWVTAEEDWWLLTTSPHLHLILALSLIALYCHAYRHTARRADL